MGDGRGEMEEGKWNMDNGLNIFEVVTINN